MRQVKPMQHVGDGGQRLHRDAADRKRRFDLTKGDPSLARHDGPQGVRVLLQQGTPVAPNLRWAVLPVWRTRCISLIAAEALTAKRRAACRIVLPPSTACTIRSRRSWDKGAVMINSTALTPSTLESEHLIPCKPEPL